MPVLNGESTIERSIKSVCSQTYTDFELLVIDNGSTDRTVKICQRIKDQDKRIKLFHCEQQGVVAARMLGLSKAAGEYIAFIDSDDTYVPEMLEKMEYAAEINGADIVSCGYIDIYADGRRKCHLPAEKGRISTDRFFNCLFEEGTLGFLWNKFYRKSVLNECEQPKNMEVCEDTFINCSLMRKNRNIIVLQECLYQYYVNPSSVTHTFEKKIDVDGNWKYLISYRKIRELFKDDPQKDYRVQVGEWWVIKLGLEELDTLGMKGKKAKKKLLSEMGKTMIQVLFSRESIRFKIGYLKCWILES